MNVGCIYSVDDFISGEKALSSYSSIPFGISFVAASLKQAGHNPRMLVFTPRTDVEAALKTFLRSHSPKLFCLTAVSSQYPAICGIARAIKQLAPRVHVLLGGHHATLNSEDAIAESSFDAVCIGEGEAAAVEYARQIENGEEPSGIANLWIRSRDSLSVERNAPAPFIQDLDSLPTIDRSMWDEWVADGPRSVTVLLGRGCPNRCTYCSNHALAKVADGRYVRFRSPQNVIRELDEVAASYPTVNSVYLEVETLQANPKYAFELCDYLERFVADLGRPMAFGTNLLVTRRMAENLALLRRLSQVGFDHVNIGLESGSERIRNEVLHRPRYSNDDLVAFCREARQLAVKVNLYVLVGIPGETPSEFAETIACVRACDPHETHLSIFYPYPGTDLYRTAKKMGSFDGVVAGRGGERKAAVLDLPGFSKRQIRREYVRFPYRVFKGKKPMRRIIPLVARNYLGPYPRLYSLYRRARSLI